MRNLIKREWYRFLTVLKLAVPVFAKISDERRFLYQESEPYVLLSNEPLCHRVTIYEKHNLA